MYIYPENLTAKPTLFLWQLRDVAILSVRVDGSSILDFLRYAGALFLTKQQYYEWRQG